MNQTLLNGLSKLDAIIGYSFAAYCGAGFVIRDISSSSIILSFSSNVGSSAIPLATRSCYCMIYALPLLLDLEPGVYSSTISGTCSN